MNKLSKTIALSVVLLMLGFLISMQIRSLNPRKLLSTNDNAEFYMLQEEVMNLMRENSILTEQNERLSVELNTLSDDIAGDDTHLNEILQQKVQAEIFAGLTDVSGAGLEILLQYGEDTPVSSGTLLVVINELRTAGALAISVSDERVVALTEIRDVGSEQPRIIINGNSYSANSEFSIKAIFREDDLSRATSLMNDVVTQLSSYGIVTLNGFDQVDIPRLSEYSMTYRKYD
ncbi:MAG TPA: DUF881 domain-containing protein [Clostridiaceae bacterium]|jgi:uncharacterized protein YlxW (UPF0749 family)|nr:DUF881 domain-containing protein [Clostridiaceae bacterium]